MGRRFVYHHSKCIRPRTSLPENSFGHRQCRSFEDFYFAALPVCSLVLAAAQSEVILK